MANQDHATETLRVGIIGTGRPRGTEGSTGFGMAGFHADGFNALPHCRVVALCDLVRERAEEFNREKAGNEAAIYTDYHQMLAEADLDIVSICTWPAQHPAMVLAAATQRGVKAIHCEKPIALTWADSLKMVRTSQENGVLLTFNHQRRFLDVFQRAKQLLRAGTIGQLQRIEGACGDLYDWGTHWFDMFGFYNDEAEPAWVIGQIDCRRPIRIFGAPIESQGISEFAYANGVYGRLVTGADANAIVGCANRLIGSEGVIEVHWSAPYLRLRTNSDTGWRIIDEEEPINGGLHDSYSYALAIADLVSAVTHGGKPLLDGANALNATALIFGTYESSRRRGRIDLPGDLDSVPDSPLASMLEAGVFPLALPTNE